MSRIKGYRTGFTLVELLVVIGIIAVLISILLPTLAAARRSAYNSQCLSNARQLTMAAMLFAHEHRGYLPTASDDRWAKMNDPMRRKWAYRNDSSAADGSGVTVYDWASSLIPYLGGKMGDTFATAPEKQSKVFRCPADQWLGVPDPGYRLFQNVPPTPAYHSVSYGYNADIACVSAAPPGGVYQGRFGYTDQVGVMWGPTGPAYAGKPKLGHPLQAKLSKIHKPAEVLLYADCGTRPQAGSFVAPLDYNDCLYYTSNFMVDNTALPAEDQGKLSGVLKTDWLKLRIPMLRHGGKRKDGTPPTYMECKVNVAFADGHAETVIQGEFNRVRITPYPPR